MKQKSAILFTLLALFSIGFLGCKDTEENTPVVSQQDQTFIKNVSASNAAEIQYGRLALQNSTNDSVKVFAQKMITDHTAAKNSLDSIVKSLNLVKNDSLDAAHKDLYTRLMGLNSTGFDSVYINNQVKDHQTTLSLLQSEMTSTGNSRVVSYARKQVPVVTMHLEHARRLKNNLANPGGGSTPGGGK